MDAREGGEEGAGVELHFHAAQAPPDLRPPEELAEGEEEPGPVNAVLRHGHRVLP